MVSKSKQATHSTEYRISENLEEDLQELITAAEEKGQQAPQMSASGCMSLDHLLGGSEIPSKEDIVASALPAPDVADDQGFLSIDTNICIVETESIRFYQQLYLVF